MKASTYSTIYNIVAALSLLVLPNIHAFSVNSLSKPSFVVTTTTSTQTKRTTSTNLFMATEEESSESDSTTKAKSSLEEKMKQWEASEEEMKAASLGGIVPKNRTDGFDIGLYIAFPLMVGASLLFVFFPLIQDSIDFTSVGPPPTI